MLKHLKPGDIMVAIAAIALAFTAPYFVGLGIGFSIVLGLVMTTILAHAAGLIRLPGGGWPVSRESRDDYSADRDRTPRAPPSPPAGAEATAQPGSDYYIPLSSEVAGAIESGITRPRQEAAILFAQRVVNRYLELVEEGGQHSIYFSFSPPEKVSDSVFDAAKDILAARGWSLSNFDSKRIYLSPEGYSNKTPVEAERIAHITSSQELESLISEKILAPRREQVNEIAVTLVRKYQEKAATGAERNQSISIVLENEIHWDFTSDIAEVLAARGWTFSHLSGSTYLIGPREPGRPYRGGGGIIF